MKTMKTILALAVSSSLFILGGAAKAQFIPVTSGTFYNNAGTADVYQFSATGSEFNGSEIAISGGQVVAWDVIDTDASTIGGASPGDATTVEIDSFDSSSLTAGTPNALLIGGGISIPSGRSGILSYVEHYDVFDGITSYDASTFTGAFDITNQYGTYGNNQYYCSAEFAGTGGASGIMADEITSYYTDINNYVSIVDDPQGNWAFAGSYSIPDAASTFELLLAAIVLTELSRRFLTFPSKTRTCLNPWRYVQAHPRHRSGHDQFARDRF